MSNNTNTKAMSFWKFMNDNIIEIPIIQRDYAHGRLGKENLRRNFLADLKKALDNESPYKDTSMKLDFIYGSIENGKLNPLDGQQRLTTLWLLHWYIALRAKQLNEDNCSIFRKFTYETRISSREFCENLCIPEHFTNYSGNDIVGFIANQTWFYSAWKQDPTIQSMLRMLGGTKVADKKGEDIIDGIEELFQNTNEDVFKDYWRSLTAKNAIVFYHLPLSDFGLSDDLYIKMNARGKQLTSFENFKADLIGYIITQAQDETSEQNNREDWESLLNPENGFPIKLDTDWTDIFWKHKSKGRIGRIDEIYFAFLNRFFWNELFIAKKPGDQESYILDIGKGDESSTQENKNLSYKYLNNSDHPNELDTTIAYAGLGAYKYFMNSIPLSFFQKLSDVLSRYHSYSAHNTLPICFWNTDFRFIPNYIEENSNNIITVNNANENILKITALNQVQRVVFYAICKYFSDSTVNQDDEISLKRWLRVVWNLVSGEDHNGLSQIRNTQAMRTAMKFISELNSHCVYESLLAYNKRLGNSDFDERCKEEIAKAKQIIDKNGNLRKYSGSCKKTDGTRTWEEVIIEAENTAFFKGAIRFLFTDDEGHNNDWINFEKKWEHAQKFFDKNGVRSDYKVLLTKLLVSKCDNWEEQIYDKQIFNPNASTWRWILTATNWIVPIHNILTCNISEIENNNSEELEKYAIPHLANLPLAYFINSEPEGRFRCHWGRLCFYKPYGRNLITFDDDNWNRNRILSSLLKSNLITTEAQINESELFGGWDINFTYNNNNFQWAADNRIYLMSKNNPNTRIETDSKNTDSYYSFDASKIEEQKIIEELNKLARVQQ